MKNFVLTAALVLALSPILGCGKPLPPPAPGTTPSTSAAPDPTASNAALIRAATAESLTVGLSFYAGQGHDKEAAIIAAQIKDFSNATALAYLNGTSGATTAAVNGFLGAQIVSLPPDAANLIHLAATVLDALPEMSAPTVTTVLSPAQLSYLTAFFQGLSDGSTQYLAGIQPSAAAKAKDQPKAVGAWFNPVAITAAKNAKGK